MYFYVFFYLQINVFNIYERKQTTLQQHCAVSLRQHGFLVNDAMMFIVRCIQQRRDVDAIQATG